MDTLVDDLFFPVPPGSDTVTVIFFSNNFAKATEEYLEEELDSPSLPQNTKSFIGLSKKPFCLVAPELFKY